MTKEEAIERISDHMEVHKIGEYPHIKLAVALNMALDALLAQQTPLDRSRWEGCPICTAHYTKQDWNTRGVGAHEFRVSGSSLMYCDQFLGWKGIGINFCPKCGRPLTEEAWAELERRISP